MWIMDVVVEPHTGTHLELCIRSVHPVKNAIDLNIVASIFLHGPVAAHVSNKGANTNCSIQYAILQRS
jgi:hypothetical protein